MNQWRLPETTAHGTCNVTVEMKAGVSSDETSWLGVSNAAAQLNTAVSDIPQSQCPSDDSISCCMTWVGGITSSRLCHFALKYCYWKEKNADSKLSQCVGTAILSSLHGGYTYTGRYDGIKIAIMYRSSQSFQVEPNGTLISVDGNNTVARMVSAD